MKITIPSNVVRKIISDILIERGNAILDVADKMGEEEIKECGVASEYQGELETTSAGTYCLADDVMCGQISIKEVLDEILTEEEKKLVKTRCMEWLNKENEIDR